MDDEKRIVRWGTGVIAFALVLKIFSTVVPLVRSLPPEYLWVAALLAQTGKPFYPLQTSPTDPEPSTTSPSPAPSVPESALPADRPAFSASDAGNINLIYGCDLRPDVESLLCSPLTWDLTQEAPSILIVHTHATECYTPAEGEDFTASGYYRTRDPAYNMVSIGAEIARILTEGGIGVIHDTTLHDDPDYNYAYINTRKTIQQYLQRYPSIRMVLDIHRDASDTQQGQLTTHGVVGGQDSAQIMLVVGTNYASWHENTALALKLSVLMERADVGITRPVYLRQERFNMDLTTGSLIVEVGAAGDTHAQAMLAANAFARSVLALMYGST